MRRLVLAILTVTAIACSTTTAPPPSPEPLPAGQAEASVPAPVGDASIGTLRVTASALNVRQEPTTAATVVAQLRRGDRISLIRDEGEWLRVRLFTGELGWVASQHVIREGAAASRGRRNCPQDTEFSFATPPSPSFSDGQKHGLVVIEATVEATGTIASTKLVSNDTGDDALAALAEREIRAAKFVAPIRNCAPRRFVYTYKRSF
ncbi:MAG TPA: SH3 domain-containing protein [Thermoanaerobaculia bacterium]|nr:SH3 domain-containing protein [Thermoanaerobaculia bacterium]